MFEAVSRLLRHPPAGTEPPVPVAPPVEIRKPYRPKIGLALGGGSARGWAHIGVMRALAEAGIEPDIIAGTSIGAVVGGCAVGGRLTELEAFARSITKRGMLHLMDFSLSGKGLISGNRLGNLLAEHLGEARVEDMPKNFTAVATELGTGHEIWLSSGNLVEAIRASYALPGIFTPIRVGGRWLVDGALVNPVPVSVCRAFGARFVIAINLAMDSFGKGSVIHQHTVLSDNDPDAPKEDARAGKKSFLRKMVGGDTTGLPGIPGVMMDAFNIIQDRITRARLAGDPPDLMVGPKLNKIGLFEFHRAAEAIDAGYEATRRQTEDIREMLAALA